MPSVCLFYAVTRGAVSSARLISLKQTKDGDGTMKRILAAFGVASLALVGTSAVASANPPEADDGGKITICHATGSESNPYVPVTISLNALNAHMDHQHNEDIIPANNGKVLPQGRNLDKVDWWNAGCAKPGGNPHNPPHDNDKKITICHATGSEKNPYVSVTISLNGLNGHANPNHQHSEDIIPPNSGKVIPYGQNWDDKGQATYNNNCVPAKPPVVPPVTPPETPPAVVPPAVVPPAPPAGEVVPGTTPRGAVAAGGGAGAVAAPNQGFNVQTAVSAPSGPGAAPWLGGLAAVMVAGAALAVRKTMAKAVVRGQHHG